MNKILTLLKMLKQSFNTDNKSVGNIPRFVPTQKSFLGKTLFIHDISSYHLGELEIFKNEVYKFNSRNDKPVIIDGGANLGMSVIYFKELYPNSSIIAFEPDPHIFDYLKRNIKSFGYQDVKIINKAVWVRDETISFLKEGGAGGRIQEVEESTDHEFVEVECIRLKQFLMEGRVDFLKLDIEGSEYEVLKDCADSLNQVANLFIEYHSFVNKAQELHKILDIIAAAGFRYHLKEASNIKYPFINRPVNNGMDSQINIFCFRN